jgi:hypothetical protein
LGYYCWHLNSSLLPLEKIYTLSSPLTYPSKGFLSYRG